MTELTPGQILVACREQRGLSQIEVARHLRLSLQTIKDIENNNYEHIGVRTYVLGYLRGYARLLHLPERRVLEAFAQLSIPMFDDQVVPVSIHNQAAKSTKNFWRSATSTVWLRRTFGLVVLMLVFVVFFQFKQSEPSKLQAKKGGHQLAKQTIPSIHLIKSANKS